MSNTWDDIGRGKISGSVTKQDIREFVEKCKKRKPFFMKYICRIPPSPKQIECLTKGSKHKSFIAVFNRQGGKSTVFAVDNAHDLLFKTHKDGHSEWIITYAPIKNQAEIIFGRTLGFIENNPLTTKWIKYKNRTGHIELMNDNKMDAKSASPTANIRGDSPTKIQIDESQDVSDKQYYESIIPSGSATDAYIQEIGTPRGRNHFYKTYNEHNEYYKVIQLWSECPFISKNYIRDKMKSMPKKSFEQEYLCKWNLDDGYAWDYNDIKNAQILPPESIPPRNGAIYVAGLDVAKSPADTVLWIAEVDKESHNMVQVHLEILSGLDWTIMTSAVIDTILEYRPKKMCFDATGIGQPAFDWFKRDMIDREPSMRYWIKKHVEPVVYTNTLKNDMVSDVDKLLCENRINANRVTKLYGDTFLDNPKAMKHIFDMNALTLSTQEEIGDELTNFRKKRTAAGRIVFFKEEGVKDDVCNSIMMGVRARNNLVKRGMDGFRAAYSGQTVSTASASLLSQIRHIERPTWD
jgi:hypothetical protein